MSEVQQGESAGDVKLITCIMPKGRAYALQESLYNEKGIQTGNFHHARGVGHQANILERGIGEQPEREVLQVVVPEQSVDEIFEYLFFEGGLDEPHGGMIYVTAIPRATRMVMPDAESDDT